ncbi:hypothetical protein AB0395_43950 [Streptosporangium sp. NPDC051023]|uniref:hypothetical protein n=1 Tax=Streptosporangium sp. NPDC051023 TaxID=3155410 RepID=UPI00344C78F4
MSTAIPMPDPDEVARGLADLERYVADQDPASTASTGLLSPVSGLAAEVDRPDGETEQVRQLRARVAEARRLVELQEDDAPLLVDTRKVRRRRARVAEAARLYALSQDPTALAWTDARVRRVSTVMVMLAATIALAVSSIGVQASVAQALDLKDDTLGWWAAFGVEPTLSLPLLAAVAVQAYAAMRGRPVDRTSPEGRKLFKTEALLLGLTLVLNCWPALTWQGFDLLPLVVHSLGPIAAVTGIWLLPTLWAILAALPGPGLTGALTGLVYRENVPPQGPTQEVGGKAGKAADLAPVLTETRRLIATGQLPAFPSAAAIRRALRCGMDTARDVRDALGGGA